MPSSLSAAMLAEKEGLNRIMPVFEMTLGGTIMRFADETVISQSQGLYSSYVVKDSWAGFGRHANDSEFSLEIPEASLTIFDQDRVIQKEIGGPSRSAIRGGVAQAFYRSRFVDESDHYKFFDGVLVDFEGVGDREYRFAASPDTRALSSQPKIPFLTKTDFPTAPASVLNQPLWIVYGKLSSSGVPDAKGMVKCLPAVEDANGDSIDWICSYGQLTGVQRLFFGDTEDTTNWSFYNLQRGGHYYQMARYTGSGTKPTPSDTIAIDCEGVRLTAPTLTAGGTGAIENPAECMRNFLAHFAYGSGSMLSDVTAYDGEAGTPIATSVFDAAETYFSTRNDVMAKVIKADQSVLDVFNAWCADFRAVPHWIDTWKFGAIPEDSAETDIFHDDRHVAEKLHHALSPLLKQRSRTKGVSDIYINYLLNESTGSLSETGRCHHPAVAEAVRETVDFEFGAGLKF